MVASLHDPYADLTPSQRLAAAARNMRHAKIASIAKPDLPIIINVPATGTISRADETWAQRQKRIHTPAKPPWFSIECEIDPSVPDRPRVDSIIAAVGKFYGVSLADILSPRRTAVVMRPRQVAMYLSKTLTLRSLPEIGRRFAGRDHTTILHAVRKIERLLPFNPELAREVEIIKAGISA